jgi:hypothetical protein
MTTLTNPEQKERSAYLVAESKFSNQEIADEVGIGVATLYVWKRDKDFMATVEEHRQAIREVVRNNGIAVLENRIASYNRRWRKCERLMEARAADPVMKNVPGGDTGLLVRSVKMIGAGIAAKEIEEFTLDASLLTKMLELEEQAAKELGQWEENHNHRHIGANGGAIKVKYDLSKLSKDDWLAIKEIRNRTRMAALPPISN